VKAVSAHATEITAGSRCGPVIFGKDRSKYTQTFPIAPLTVRAILRSNHWATAQTVQRPTRTGSPKSDLCVVRA
jgi:hypothetical protein